MADKYRTLEELKAALQEKRDYRIKIVDRNSTVTIISPHGGLIEAGSSALAAAVAGQQYNLYDFQGLQANNPQELHVSSTRFRDADLSSLLSRSELAISIHGMGNQGEAVIWLGGLHRELKDLVLANLLARGFAVNPDPPRYRGESPVNVVNLARQKGVQLELSDELSEQLFDSKPFLAEAAARGNARFALLVEALQEAVLQVQAMEAVHKCA